MSDTTYFSCSETAVYLRKALNKAFPGVKFSVRSDTYSMGASINVRWVDGPEVKDVRRIASLFECSGFDGMIDLKYHYTMWVMPDGSVNGIANLGGTVGSMGTVEPIHNPKPHPQAFEVSFGADSVHCTRDTAKEAAERLEYEYVSGRDVVKRMQRGDVPVLKKNPDKAYRGIKPTFADGRITSNKIMENLIKSGRVHYNDKQFTLAQEVK